MSEPIKVGDLVVVVRWGRCKCNGRVGLIFQVGRIGTYTDGGRCTTCGTNSMIRPGTLFSYAEGVGGRPYVPLQWLKRIPPLSELDDVKRDEEIAA